MTTLQTGTKVTIEATVEDQDKYFVELKTKSNEKITLPVKFIPDLTVCETAEPIDKDNWKVKADDPNYHEVGRALFDKHDNWKDFDVNASGSVGKVYGYSKYNIVSPVPTITGQQALKLLGVEPIPAPSFKAGQEVEFPILENIYKGRIQHIHNGKAWITWGDGENNNYMIELFQLHPIPAQPTVEAWWKSPLTNELVAILKGIAERHNNGWDLQGYEELLAWHQKHSGRVEVSESEIDEPINNAYKEAQKYSNKTFPIDSMQKDKIHFDAGVEHMKRYVKHEFTSHFMVRKRVEVSVPVSDKDILKYYDELAKHNGETTSLLCTVRHFMTRKEAGSSGWLDI